MFFRFVTLRYVTSPENCKDMDTSIFPCYVVQGSVTVFSSQTSNNNLDDGDTAMVTNAIQQTIETGNLVDADNRILAVTWSGFDENDNGGAPPPTMNPLFNNPTAASPDNGSNEDDIDGETKGLMGFFTDLAWWVVALIVVFALLVVLLLAYNFCCGCCAFGRNSAAGVTVNPTSTTNAAIAQSMFPSSVPYRDSDDDDESRRSSISGSGSRSGSERKSTDSGESFGHDYHHNDNDEYDADVNVNVNDTTTTIHDANANPDDNDYRDDRDYQQQRERTYDPTTGEYFNHSNDQISETLMPDLDEPIEEERSEDALSSQGGLQKNNNNNNNYNQRVGGTQYTHTSYDRSRYADEYTGTTPPSSGDLTLLSKSGGSLNNNNATTGGNKYAAGYSGGATTTDEDFDDDQERDDGEGDGYEYDPQPGSYYTTATTAASQYDYNSDRMYGSGRQNDQVSFAGDNESYGDDRSEYETVEEEYEIEYTSHSDRHLSIHDGEHGLGVFEEELFDDEENVKPNSGTSAGSNSNRSNNGNAPLPFLAHNAQMQQGRQKNSFDTLRKKWESSKSSSNSNSQNTA